MSHITEPVIPAATKLAAKRGFIRTSTQTLSSAIPIGAISIVLSQDWVLGVALGIGGALVSAALSGAASYLSIIAKGVPDVYTAPGVKIND